MYKHSYSYSLLGEDKKEKSTKLAGAEKSLKDGAGTHSRLPVGLEQNRKQAEHWRVIDGERAEALNEKYS